MNDRDLKTRLDLAVAAARDGGEIARRLFHAPALDVEWKPDRTPVTRADRETEGCIRERLEKAFPEDGILGEEEGETASKSGRRWYIDPIDGTKSFIRGVPLFGTLLAMEEEGELLIGVIHLPALGETVYAARGLGAWWIPAGGDPAAPRQARVSGIDELSRAAASITSIRGALDEGFADKVEALAGRVSLIRGWGDCYGHLMVATGRLEMMIDPAMSPWDCAALLPVIEEAGGTYTDLDGKRTIRGRGALSSNGPLHAEILDLLTPRVP